MVNSHKEGASVVTLRRRASDQDGAGVSDRDLITSIIESERRTAEAYRDGSARRIQSLEDASRLAQTELGMRVKALEEFQRKVMRRVFWVMGGFAGLAAVFAVVVYVLELLGPTVLRQVIRSWIGA